MQQTCWCVKTLLWWSGRISASEEEPLDKVLLDIFLKMGQTLVQSRKTSCDKCHWFCFRYTQTTEFSILPMWEWIWRTGWWLNEKKSKPRNFWFAPPLQVTKASVFLLTRYPGTKMSVLTARSSSDFCARPTYECMGRVKHSGKGHYNWEYSLDGYFGPRIAHEQTFKIRLFGFAGTVFVEKIGPQHCIGQVKTKSVCRFFLQTNLHNCHRMIKLAKALRSFDTVCLNLAKPYLFKLANRSALWKLAVFSDLHPTTCFSINRNMCHQSTKASDWDRLPLLSCRSCCHQIKKKAACAHTWDHGRKWRGHVQWENFTIRRQRLEWRFFCSVYLKLCKCLCCTCLWLCPSIGGGDAVLRELSQQFREMRDFLEIELAHHRETLETFSGNFQHGLARNSGNTSFQNSTFVEAVKAGDEAEEVETKEHEDEEEQDKTADDVIQSGNDSPVMEDFQRNSAKLRGSFVEAAVHSMKAKAQMQSHKLRVSKHAHTARQENQERTWRTVTKEVVFSPGFSGFITVLILLNVILLGVEVDVSASLDISEVPSWFGTVNAIIVCFFVVEIALKLFAVGCREFWRGRDCIWNMLDFFIVSISVVDVLLDILAHMLSASSLQTGHLRLVRSIRLARALRGVKVVRIFRYITALRTLALSIISTMGSLFWTLMLLMLVFYFFAVVITQLVTDHCRELKAEDPDIQCPALLLKYWASVGESSLSLDKKLLK